MTMSANELLMTLQSLLIALLLDSNKLARGLTYGVFTISKKLYCTCTNIYQQIALIWLPILIVFQR